MYKRKGIFLPVFFILFAGEGKAVVCTLEVLERGLTVYDWHIRIHTISFKEKNNEVHIYLDINLKTV
jgi:hypothetical protein